MFERSGIMKKNRSRKNVILFLVIVIGFIAIIVSNVTATKYTETKKIVVGNNDTLWNIAENICKKNDELNIYEVISDIKKLNDLESSVMYPEDILLVYVY